MNIKRLLRSFAVTVCVFVFETQSTKAQCLAPPNGLVAWLPGDTNAADLLGRNNGVFAGGATIGDGLVQSAFHFDGIDGTVSVPFPNGFDFGVNDFTVEFWVRFEDLQDGSNGLISKDSFDGGNTFSGWVINIFDGAGGFGFQTRHLVNGIGVDTSARWPESNLQAHTWYHVAAIRKASVLSLFINGVLRASAVESQPTDVTCSSELTLGSLNTAHVQAFAGALDEVSIYNRALSATEVSTIYSAGTAGKCKLFFTTLPQSQVGYVTQSATFNVGVGGTAPFGYQWYFGSNQIAGATSQTLTVTNLHATNAGSYSVLVTNSVGTITSPPAILTVNDASIALYAGVTLYGDTGTIYGIQYSTNLNNTNGWVGVTNVTLNTSAQVWYDTEPAIRAARFYRVLPGPISIP